MKEITFGSTIWTDAGGNTYSFTKGQIKRRWTFVSMGRADGEIPKAGGLAGCDHQLVLTFISVPVAEVSALFTRMDELAQAIAEETLTVPGYGSFPNCTCTDVQASPQTRSLKTLKADMTGVSEAYRMEFSLVFHQSRP